MANVLADPIADPLTDDSWAIDAFGAADLGDARLTARLIQLATVLGNQPQGSIPHATADVATMKAAYRFFANPAVDPDAILHSQVHATVRRMRAVPRVLAVQDTTYLDFTTHPQTSGLGPLASRSHQGLLLHTTMAFTPDRLPLGLLQQQIWARPPDLATDHKTRPIADKESQKWLESVDALLTVQGDCPDTHLISVGDREADVYDLFLLERPVGIDLLVRAAQDRLTDSPERRLWATMTRTPVVATVAIRMGARANQPARTVQLDIRWKQVTLRPPSHRASEHLPTIPVWAVWAVESHPPPGVKPVEWLLLTTVPVTNTADALERLDWYTVRWGIEVWHRILKSGCRIEARQLTQADRLERCLTLYSVIAWHLQYATMLARVAPDLPCSVVLSADEWEGLYCRIHATTIPPPTPPSLRQAIRWIAQLGGFIGRKGDGEPGVTTLWRGWQRLDDIAAMYRLFRSMPSISAPLEQS